MNWKIFTLILAGILGALIFLLFRFSADIGFCQNIETYSDGSTYCISTRGWGNFIWPLLDFSLAMFAVGILNLMKPIANRALLIITALFAAVTAIAVFSAPAISGSFLSPFDKKFVGQICAWGYVLISVAVWARAVLKTRKISI